MAAKDTVRRNKTTLQDILSTDRSYILDRVYEKELITGREYNNLRDVNKEDVEGHVIRLVDKLMNKGEDICQAFLNMLQTDEDIKNTYPRLKNIPWDSSCLSSTPFESFPVPESKRQKKDEYQLTSKPTGLCVIINNENFDDGTSRKGTNKDTQSLAEVFSWLGFRVLMCKDQTRDQMDQALKCFADLSNFPQLQNVQEWSGTQFTDLKELPRHGDAFICCILSHGSTGSVSGTDRGPLPITDITSTFNGKNCPSLVDKPKVFFIQACQGGQIQQGVLLQDLAEDAASIPLEADFLVAISSVENCKAFRDPQNGSWFIQGLCRQLKEGCARGDDLMNILYRVNDEVSQKEGMSSQPGLVKQMSEARNVTLRRSLVLSPYH